ISLLPAYGSRTLVALDAPIVFSDAEVHQPTFTVRTDLIAAGDREVRLVGSSDSVSYRAFSVVSLWSRATLSEDERRRRLQLPASLDPRIPELAEQLAEGTGTDFAVARQLERGLKIHYGYTLQLPGPVKDPLADFLFDRRAGHCEDFATALAVLLRARGIPSRVVVGFNGGARSPRHYPLPARDPPPLA